MTPSTSFKNVTLLAVELDVNPAAPFGRRDVYRMRFGDHEVLVPEWEVMGAGTRDANGKWTWHHDLEVGVTYDELDVVRSWAVKAGLA